MNKIKERPNINLKIIESKNNLFLQTSKKHNIFNLYYAFFY